MDPPWDRHRCERKQLGPLFSAARTRPGLRPRRPVRAGRGPCRHRPPVRPGPDRRYAGLAPYLGGLPLPGPFPVCWLDGPEAVRARWHRLVQARRARLRGGVVWVRGQGGEVQDTDRFAGPPVGGGGGDDPSGRGGQGWVGPYAGSVPPPRCRAGPGRLEVQVEHGDARQRGQVIRLTGAGRAWRANWYGPGSFPIERRVVGEVRSVLAPIRRKGAASQRGRPLEGSVSARTRRGHPGVQRSGAGEFGAPLVFLVDRSTVTRAIGEIRGLLAERGCAVPDRPGLRLRTLADVFAYAQAEGIELRLDATEVQVRRPAADRAGRRAFVSGKKKQNQDRLAARTRGQRRRPAPTLIEAHHRRARTRRSQTLEATDPLDPPTRDPTRHLLGPRRPRLRPHRQRVTSIRQTRLHRYHDQLVSGRPSAPALVCRTGAAVDATAQDVAYATRALRASVDQGFRRLLT